jgi:hypothetical protein
MSETVSKYFSDDVLFINLFPIPFCFDWPKLKHTWNIKMHKMCYIVESRYVKLCLLEISVKSIFVWSPVLNLVLFNLIYHSYLKFRRSIYAIVSSKTSSLKYLLTVSDIFDMHKILVIILKVSSSLVYPQVSLYFIHISYIYTLYIAWQIDYRVPYTLSYKSTNWFLKNLNLFYETHSVYIHYFYLLCFAVMLGSFKGCYLLLTMEWWWGPLCIRPTRLVGYL